jgi:hypothetical protein
MQHIDARIHRVAFPGLLFAVSCMSACGGGGGGGSPTPALTAPATGAVWGATRSIWWTPDTTDGGTATVYLSDDGGATYGTVLASATPDDGAQPFDTTAFADGEEYRVRIVLSSGVVLTSGEFALDNTAPVTSLTSPLGNEILGLSSSVTWTTTDVHPGTWREQPGCDRPADRGHGSGGVRREDLCDRGRDRRDGARADGAGRLRPAL